jgi:hypothetical protein
VLQYFGGPSETLSANPWGFAIAAGIAALQSYLAHRSANKAATTQEDAANYAANLQFISGQQQLALQLGALEQQQHNIQPWLDAGGGGLGRLANLLGVRTRARGASGVPGAPAQPTAGPAAAMPQFRPATSFTRTWPDGRVSEYSNVQQYADDNYATVEQVQKQFDEHMAEAQATRRSEYEAELSEYLNRPGAADPGGGTEPGGTDGSGLPQEYDPTGADFGELLQGYQAPAPFAFDPSQVGSDPGYQFRLKQGMEALQRSAAAKGSLFGGSTLKRLTEFAQGTASDEFGRAYARKAGEYDRDFANSFNVFNTNATNKHNRLASLAGIGQTAATTINNAQQNYADQGSRTLQQTNAARGEYATQAGNARASGYIGSANAWNQGLGSIGNNAMLWQLMQQRPGNTSDI